MGTVLPEEGAEAVMILITSFQVMASSSCVSHVLTGVIQPSRRARDRRGSVSSRHTCPCAVRYDVQQTNDGVQSHWHRQSSFVNQIGARTKFPTYRLNLDSEITRLDLIGRDTLIEQDGITVSKFVDGILPKVMGKACIIQCDEVDFARPDVLYALQPVLEENGTLRVTEDGGKWYNDTNGVTFCHS